MIRNYSLTFVCLAAFCGGISAQSGTADRHSATKPERRVLPANMIINPTRGSAANIAREAFFTEDFSGGAIPAGWTNVDIGTPSGGTPVVFEWSNAPGVVTAASGSYPDLVGTFAAPGASNGFLWADSDRGLTAAPGEDHITQLTTGAIDCSLQPSVMLTMQSTIGVFENDANEFVKVRVSTDLTNWQDFFPFPCLETGAPIQPCARFSDNPTFVMVDLSPAAAGQPVVYIQFQWQGGWEYYWAIDDVELAPLPDNDLRMNFGYVSTTGDGEEYGRIPATQLPATLNVGAEILNFGLTEHTNLQVNCSIDDADGNEVITSTVTIPSLASQTTIVTDEDPLLPTLAPGLYTADFTMSSDQIALDQNPDDNSRVRTLEVTENLYSLDNIGNHPAGLEVLSQTGSGSFADNSENVKLMNLYHLNTPMTVTGVQVKLGSATNVGSLVVISVLDTADVLNDPAVVNNPVDGLETDFHTITQADVEAGEVNIPFAASATLQPNAYYVTASLFAVNDSNVYILDDTTVPQPTLASILWIPVDPDGIFLYGGNGNAWAIRLSSDPSIGLQENPVLGGVTIFPDQTNGIFRVNNTVTSKCTIEVLDVMGKVVMTDTFTGHASIDLVGHACGVYTVRVSDGKAAHVQRITRH